MSLMSFGTRWETNQASLDISGLDEGVVLDESVETHNMEVHTSTNAGVISLVCKKRRIHADALSKLASSSFAHLTKKVLVEVVPSRSTKATTINIVEESDLQAWIRLYYLRDGNLPGDPTATRKIRIKAPQYFLSQGIFYRFPMNRGTNPTHCGGFIQRRLRIHADALSKLASSSFAHLTKKVLVEVIPSRSTKATTINIVEESDLQAWIRLYYLRDGNLPGDPTATRKIRIKAPQYSLSQDFESSNRRAYVISFPSGLVMMRPAPEPSLLDAPSMYNVHVSVFARVSILKVVPPSCSLGESFLGV
nr:hypothetical protein [Tanacetum cinerariifolium]